MPCHSAIRQGSDRQRLGPACSWPCATARSTWCVAVGTAGRGCFICEIFAGESELCCANPHPEHDQSGRDPSWPLQLRPACCAMRGLVDICPQLRSCSRHAARCTDSSKPVPMWNAASCHSLRQPPGCGPSEPPFRQASSGNPPYNLTRSFASRYIAHR